MDLACGTKELRAEKLAINRKASEQIGAERDEQFGNAMTWQRTRVCSRYYPARAPLAAIATVSFLRIFGISKIANFPARNSK